VKLHTFMTTPELAGAEFSGPTWSTWRIIARLIDGDAHLLSPEEQALALELTGRTTLPTVAPREFYIGAGRRSGKSRFGSLFAVWLAAQEYPQLARGETAVVVDVAPDRRQASIDLDYSRGLVEGSAILSAEATSTQETLTFRHRTQLEVATASFRTVRGRTLAGAVVDESAFLRSDESALPDLELARALRPALLTLNGLMLVISSPHRKVGLLHDGYKRYFGNDSETRGIYIQASSRQLNPSLNEEMIAEAMRDDPASGASEYLGQFRADLQSFLDDATVDSAIVPDRKMLTRMIGTDYVAFTDVSGGTVGGDDFTVAVAHAEHGRLVLDVARAFHPPFAGGPSEIVRQCAETLSSYGLSTVTGDAYAASWASDEWRKCGVVYNRSTHSKNEIYLEVLPLFTSGVVELLDIPQLRTQFLLLERRTRSGGHDSVDHPRGARDDLCNSAAGALRLASKLAWSGRSAESPLRGRHLRSADVDPYPDPQEVADRHRGQGNAPIRDGWGRIVRGA
jgi:hypothetical protein